MKRFLSAPTPLWATVLLWCLLLVSIGTAATVTYTGSFKVASSGTFTDSNQSASSVGCYNASHQLTSSCASISPTFNNITGAAGTFSGLLTGAGITAGTGTVKGASDSATTTYLSPVYTASGGAIASTAHEVWITSGSVTPSVTACDSGGSGSCLLLIPSISWSGAAAWSTFLGCTGTFTDNNGTIHTGPITGYANNGEMGTVGYTGFSTGRAFSYTLACWGT